MRPICSAAFEVLILSRSLTPPQNPINTHTAPHIVRIEKGAVLKGGCGGGGGSRMIAAGAWSWLSEPQIPSGAILVRKHIVRGVCEKSEELDCITTLFPVQSIETAFKTISLGSIFRVPAALRSERELYLVENLHTKQQLQTDAHEATNSIALMCSTRIHTA